MFLIYACKYCLKISGNRPDSTLKMTGNLLRLDCNVGGLQGKWKGNTKTLCMTILCLIHYLKKINTKNYIFVNVKSM